MRIKKVVSMKTLLVAVRPEDRELTMDIAAHQFRVYVASSIKEAINHLRNGDIDGIVCGVHFNEGGLFQFLEQVRANPKVASLPFICVKGNEDRLPPASYHAIELACSEKGVPYIDAVEMVKRLGIPEGYAELRKQIADILDQSKP